VDFLGVELFRNGGIAGHIRKKHCHKLTLSLNGAAGGEDFIRQELGGVGLGLRVVYGRGFGWFR